jgi:hypothetical protein
MRMSIFPRVMTLRWRRANTSTATHPKWGQRIIARELFPVALLLLWCTWFNVPVLRRMTEPLTSSDYLPHAQWTAQLANGLPLSEFLSHAPHFLFHLTVLLAHILVPWQTFLETSAFVALAFNLLLAIAIYLFLQRFVGRPENAGAAVIYAFGAAVLTFIMPINLLTPGNLYFGYVAPTVYHSPTMTTLKPLSVLLFGLCISIYSNASASTRRTLVCALLTILCSLAKPNYMMALVPALAVLALYRWRRGQPVSIRFLVWGIVLPSALVFGLQAGFFSTGQIAFQPLGFLDAHAVGTPDANRYLVIKLILSAAFPLAVYMMYWPATERDTRLILAWLTFGVSLLYAYFLIEANRVSDGNFIWGSQVALFILFLASFVVFLRENIPLVRGENLRHLMPRLAIGICILGLHVVSGIVWYQAHLVGGMAVTRYW